MVPALNGVSLGRILQCQQVIGDRNDGEQNQDEQSQGNKLGAAVDGRARRPLEPQANHGDGHNEPGKIEEKFHSLPRF